MYTPTGFIIAEALVSIALALAGFFLFLSIKKLVELKKSKSEVLKPQDLEKIKKKKLPFLYFEVFYSALIFLLMVHVYFGLMR